MRTVGVVTVGRSDYGPYRPLLRRIAREDGLSLRLFVAGTHLSPAFGDTIREIEADGFPIAQRVETLVPGDSPQAMAHSIGRGVVAFTDAFVRLRPDLLVVLGDRYDMFAAALAALPLTIPVAHIHGGELTQGAIDDALRHGMSKLSHLHFASTEEHARRIRQLGEEAWRVTVSGAPALDGLDSLRRLSDAELTGRLGIALEPQPLLVTYHPVTLEFDDTARQVRELLAALARAGQPAVFTSPNGDAGSGVILEAIRKHVGAQPGSVFIENLGSEAYASLMARSAAMVGNSSSGIVEAASFGLPVVNVGSRQMGRTRARNVIDVGATAAEIEAGIRKAATPSFRQSLAGLRNPYGDGHASEIIVGRLKSVPLDAKLLRKVFADA